MTTDTPKPALPEPVALIDPRGLARGDAALHCITRPEYRSAADADAGVEYVPVYTRAAIAAAVAEARAVPEAALRYLRDTAQTGTPNEQAVARTVMHLLSAAPSPAEQPKPVASFKPTGGCTCAGPDGPCEACISNKEAYEEWLLDQQPAPPARVVMSDEQILRLHNTRACLPDMIGMKEQWPEILRFARAVIAEYERLSGITPAQ